MSVFFLLITVIPFYLLGAFPTGFLVSKLHGIDIASQGSGNVGATNVARVLGKLGGILSLLGDVVLGLLGVGIGYVVSDQLWFVMCAAAAVVLGHCFSIPPYLKGGKGVATALGVTIAASPIAGCVALITFAVVFALSRFVSLASIAATASVPLWFLIANADDATTAGFMAIATILILRHQQNIRRLIEGREPKFVPKSAR